MRRVKNYAFKKLKYILGIKPDQQPKQQQQQRTRTVRNTMSAKNALDSQTYSVYYNTLRGKILIMIRDDLTIGQTDQDLPEYSSNEIQEFIRDNNKNIDRTIDKMIQEYYEDNDLESLNDPEFSWIREYLYEFVDTRGNKDSDKDSDDSDDDEDNDDDDE